MSLYTGETLEEAIVALVCAHAESRGKMNGIKGSRFFIHSGGLSQIVSDASLQLVMNCIIAPSGFKLGNKRDEHYHYEVTVTIEAKPIACPDNITRRKGQ